MKNVKTAVPETPKTCTVCFEDFGKFRKPVPCPSCPEKNPPSVCRSCTEEYLLESPRDAHCMQCKHEWGYQFTHEAFSSVFSKTYRQNRQEKALEREKGLLQQTLPLVALEREKKDATERLKILRQEAAELKKEYAAKLAVIESQMREEMHVIKGKQRIIKNNTPYLFRCPVENDGEQCRGYIESSSWKCGLCQAEICKKCHCVRSESTKKKHICKKEDVETAKAVMAETKPCPKCTARIFKIQGCDQMFCTQCSTPFSWNTGEIVTGVIHNPHYYEMLRATGVVQRNAGDAPCGGMPWFDSIYIYAKVCSDEIREKLTTAHRRCSEIENYIANQRRKLEGNRGLEDVRLRWLLGEFKDEKAWQRSIFIRERSINKKREELAILDTFLTGSIERFNDYIQECSERHHSRMTRFDVTKLTVKLLEDIEKIRTFCNHAFVINFKALEYKKWPQIDFKVEYKKSTGHSTELGDRQRALEHE